MTTFKYDIIEGTYQYSSQLDSYLNQLGKNGWELINCQIIKEKSGYSEFIKIVGVMKKRNM